jgi:hypothetical protein
MKKRQIFPLWSFGAEVSDPELKDLSDWVRGRRIFPCDLVTYKLEHSLAKQADVDMPCYGGLDYRMRIVSSLEGVTGGFLRGEPALDFGMLLQDAKSALKMNRQVRVCLPSPLSLGIEDGYYGDFDDFTGALAMLYRKMIRELRDAGIKKCVIIGDQFSSIELEELVSGKTFFFSPPSTSAVLCAILEVQDAVAVPALRLVHLLELLNEYDINSAALIDAGPRDFEMALRAFDPEHLLAGGYSTENKDDYWTDLRKRAYVDIEYF